MSGIITYTRFSSHRIKDRGLHCYYTVCVHEHSILCTTSRRHANKRRVLSNKRRRVVCWHEIEKMRC